MREDKINSGPRALPGHSFLPVFRGGDPEAQRLAFNEMFPSPDKSRRRLWTGFLFSISYEPNFCYLVFCSIFSVSQFCLIVIRYSICIYGESRHMLFWIPQYLYVFVSLLCTSVLPLPYMKSVLNSLSKNKKAEVLLYLLFRI